MVTLETAPIATMLWLGTVVMTRELGSVLRTSIPTHQRCVTISVFLVRSHIYITDVLHSNHTEPYPYFTYKANASVYLDSRKL